MSKKAKGEGNWYDKIIKENINAMFLPLLDKYQNLKIVKSTNLEHKLQTTTEKEADFLKMVETAEGESFILHIEFQSDNEKDMIYRIKEYNALIQRKYQMEIRHYVIYLGKSKMNMKTHLPEEQIFTSYKVLNLQGIAFEELLESQLPESIILAILANFKGTDSEQVIRAILEKLKRVSSNKSALRKYINQLQILSQLRKLDNVTKKIVNDMPITIDITQNAMYKSAWKKGMKDGMEKGMKDGMEKGIHVMKQIIKAIREGKTDEEISKQTGCSVEKIEKLRQELLEES